MTYREQIDTIRYMMSSFFAYRKKEQIQDKPKQLAWSAIYSIAKSHSITSLMLAVFEPYIENEPQLLAAWKKDASILSAKHLVQKLEFSSISAKLHQEKINYMPLKGFKMKALYPSAELREMSDMDICVNPEDFDRVTSILHDMGYKLDHTTPVHDSFVKPPFSELEIHRMLFLEKPDFRVTDYQCKRDFPYERSFDATEELVFLLLHAKKHDDTGGCGVRTVIDIYLYLDVHKSELDMDRLRVRIEEENLKEFFESITRLASFWFEGAKLDEATVDFELFTVSGGTYGSGVNLIEKGVEKRGFGFYLWRIFPDFQMMSHRYPVLKKCAILLPFLYIWRWIESIFNGGILKNIRFLREKSKNKKIKREYKEKEINQ